MHTHTNGYGHGHGLGHGHTHVLDKEGAGFSQADDDNSLQFTGFNRDGSR